MSAYFLCEPSGATAMTRWHIRPSGPGGPRYSGGVDTTSLCGRITPQRNGWDLRVDFAETLRSPLGRAHVCAACLAAYEVETLW